MVNIKARDINEVYLKVLLSIFEQDKQGNYTNAYITDIDAGSYGKDKGGGGQQRLQIELLAVEIEHPESRPLQIVMSSAVGMPSVNDLDYIEKYANNYILSSLIPENELYTYGSRIFEHPSLLGKESNKFMGVYYRASDFNQFEWVVDHFKKNPQNNHCCIQIATGYDLEMKSAPCIRLVDLKIVNNKLNMTLYVRSWDLYTGFPSNLAAFQLLNEALVEEIGGGLTTGKLFGVSSGAHVYSSSWQYACLPYKYYVLGEGR